MPTEGRVCVAVLLTTSLKFLFVVIITVWYVCVDTALHWQVPYTAASTGGLPGKLSLYTRDKT
jgi:hypothetical protein